MNNTKTALICIHVESDWAIPQAGKLGKPEKWTGFEKSFEHVNRLKKLFDGRLKIEWMIRTDPQVERVYGSPSWALEHYHDLIQQLTASGDDIGLHVHTYKADDKSSTWKTELQDQEWINHCITSSYETYKNHMGYGPLSIAMGNNWINQATIDLIEATGIRFELTIIARAAPKNYSKTLRANDKGTDFSDIQPFPYRAMKNNFRMEDPQRNDALWMLPASSLLITPKRSFLSKLNIFGRETPEPTYKKFEIRYSKKLANQLWEEQSRTGREPFFYFECRSNLFNDTEAVANLEYLVEFFVKKGYSFETVKNIMDTRVSAPM